MKFGPYQCTPTGDEVLAFPLHLARAIRNLMIGTAPSAA
jgi:hypothetical protein